MSKLSLAVEPLTSKRAIACPACDRTLALIDGKGVTMAVIDTVLYDDADIVPGVEDKTAGMHSLCLAGVGLCPYCSNKHWVLEVCVHEGSKDALMTSFQDCPDWERSWISPEKQGGDGPLWTAHECSTKAGQFFSIYIGPMSVPADLTTHGPNGVSSCGGGGGSRSFWEHAAENFRAMQPQLQATVHEMKGEGQ